MRISAPPELAGMTLESRLISYDWDNQFQSFQDATTKGSFRPLCYAPRGTLLEVSRCHHRTDSICSSLSKNASSHLQIAIIKLNAFKE